MVVMEVGAAVSMAARAEAMLEVKEVVSHWDPPPPRPSVAAPPVGFHRLSPYRRNPVQIRLGAHEGLPEHPNQP